MEDIEIARNAHLKRISERTEKLNIPEEYIDQYGKYKAKISYKYLEQIQKKKDGKLILVTSINPTPLGEGKTTASIGITDGLCKIGKNAILTLREPSLGPVFGIKGGATGGGCSQVAPMEDINLHFTGDIHAVTSANNLLSALIDNHIFHGNEKKIAKVTWKRCIDLNDRELRKVEVGLSNERNMKSREDGFDISVASEIMAILCLSKDLQDLKRRIGNIIIGYDVDGKKVTCKDIKAEGSMAVLLKDAINPNIVQTLENNPVMIHGGPFANIAHGCNSLIATKMALKMADYVVTEAGFGADLGAEKFINIKSRKLGKAPDAVVIVATLRAIKYHGKDNEKAIIERNEKNTIAQNNEIIDECNDYLTRNEYDENNEKAIIEKGLQNLKKHISNMKNFGLNVIVAINKFENDNEEELEFLKQEIKKECDVSILDNWKNGSEGSSEFAKKLAQICENSKEENQEYVKYTYNLEDTIKEKIEKIATKIYGADGVEYSKDAANDIKKLQEDKNAKIAPICMAKTQYSLTDDPKKIGVYSNFKIHVQSIEYKAGAEFIVAKTGKIMTMPGLPRNPASEKIDIDKDGNIIGIF